MLLYQGQILVGPLRHNNNLGTSPAPFSLRGGGAVGILAGAEAQFSSILYGPTCTPRSTEYSLLLAVVRGDVNLALTLGHFAELHHAIDLADDCGFSRLAGFEQLDHARQTTGDVLGPGGFTRDLGQYIARKDLVPILNQR